MRIICHPENFDWLKQHFPAATAPSDGFLTGIQIIPDPNCPIYQREWVFPRERFVEYEKSDEAWAIPLGFGRWQETKDRVFHVIKDPVAYYSLPFYQVRPGGGVS